MSSLTYVHCWKPSPGLQWRCCEGVSGIVVDAATKEEAIAHFNFIWAFRSPVEWKYEAPPIPRRRGEKQQAVRVIEHDVILYAALAKRFHPDLLGSKRRFSAHEIMLIINELRGAK